MKRSAATASGPASRKVAVSRPVTISFKQGSHKNRRASFSDIHSALLWLYSLQQRHLHPGGISVPLSKREELPKPDWLTVQNGQNIGAVLVVMIPYLDAELLRVYASSDPRVLGASSQLSQQTLQEFFGPEENVATDCGFRSILKIVAGNKIRMRPPRIASSPYCSMVQSFFSFAMSSKTFRGIPIGDSAHIPGIVCLSHYLLTPEELHARGFPGFEEGADPDVPDGYITLHGISENRDAEPPRRSLMYGVDCEMVDTAGGKELGRVCIVDCHCKVILDVLVKPSGPVLDYLTQFSGLTKEILDEATLSLEDVHEILKKQLPSDAILVGHSLEHDLRALRLVHRRCIDTTVLYPHNREGFNLSLKRLAQLYLKKNMKRICGHDPREDAQVAMLLALKKIENGPGFAVPMTQLVPLSQAMRKVQRDLCEPAALQFNKSVQKTTEKAAREAHHEEKGSGFLFLVDSFKYESTSSLQDVSLKDGLADDGAVVRVCKDVLKSSDGATSVAGSSPLPSEAASDPRAGISGSRPRWGLCVLRAYQRLCCRALRAPVNRLYAFNHQPRKFLAAEAQLRKKLEKEEPALPTSSSSSSADNDEGSHSAKGASEGLHDDFDCENCLEDPTIKCCLREDGKGLNRDVKSLFPPVCNADAMQVLARIDRLLADLVASLQPQDAIIVISPCGDAYRYFSLRAMQLALQGDESADSTSLESQGSAPMQRQNNPDIPLVPLEWTPEFERELEKAKNTFDGPAKGGWCSIFIRQPD